MYSTNDNIPITPATKLKTPKSTTPKAFKNILVENIATMILIIIFTYKKKSNLLQHD